MPTTVIKWNFVLKQIVFLSSKTLTHHIRIQKQSSVLWFMNCSEIIRTCPFKQLLKTSIIVLTEICMVRVATFLSKWFFFIVLFYTTASSLWQEHVLLLTRSNIYCFDAFAIKQKIWYYKFLCWQYALTTSFMVYW